MAKRKAEKPLPSLAAEQRAENRNWRYGTGTEVKLADCLMDAGKWALIVERVPGVMEPGYIVHLLGESARFWIRESEIVEVR